MSVEGLRVIKGRHDPARTLARAQAAIKRNGLKLFASIDHGAEAEDEGADLRPTLVLIFGRPSAENHEAPRRKMVGATAMLSTLFTVGGHP